MMNTPKSPEISSPVREKVYKRWGVVHHATERSHAASLVAFPDLLLAEPAPAQAPDATPSSTPQATPGEAANQGATAGAQAVAITVTDLNAYREQRQEALTHLEQARALVDSALGGNDELAA